MKIRLSTFLLFLMAACSGPQESGKIPDHILPMDSVAIILRDIHELESSLMLSSIRQDSAQNLYRILEEDLFKKHRLDSGRFNKSLRFYAENPVLLDSLYRRVLKKTDSSAVYRP
jgi:hypothetical protein